MIVHILRFNFDNNLALPISSLSIVELLPNNYDQIPGTNPVVAIAEPILVQMKHNRTCLSYVKSSQESCKNLVQAMLSAANYHVDNFHNSRTFGTLLFLVPLKNQ